MKRLGLLLIVFLLVVIPSCSRNRVAVKTPLESFTEGEIFKKAEFYCAAYGLSPKTVQEDRDVWEKLVNDTAKEYAYADIAYLKARELNLLPLTEEEESAAAALFDSDIRSVDKVIAVTAGQAPKETERQLLRKKYIAGLGFDDAAFLENSRKKIMQKKIISFLANDIDITEEEIQSEYFLSLAQQKKYFSEHRELVAGTISAGKERIYYYPENLKQVKLILVPFDSSVQGRAATLQMEERQSEYDELVIQAEHEIAAMLDDVRIKLKCNVSETLLEYNANVKEQLFYGGDPAASPALLGAFNQLKNPGDIVECNIILGHVFMIYDREVPAGEVPCSEIRDEIIKKLKDIKSILLYEKKMKEWYDEGLNSSEIVISVEGGMPV